MKTNLKLQPNFETEAAAAAEEIVYRERDVLGIALDRVGRGITMANRLLRAAKAVGSEAATREAFLLRQCAAAENVMVAQSLDAENAETGKSELFDGVGVLAGCGSRLCPSCCADLRRRSRSRARAGLAAAGKAFYKERRKFVTLTSPTAQGASVLESIAFINGAFARLRKKAFWQSRVRGAIKGVEFTNGSLGYHAHIHLIVVGSFLERGAAQEAATVVKRAKAAAEKEAKAKAAKGRRLKVVESKTESKSLPPLGNLQDSWAECLLAEAKARKWSVVRSAVAAEAAATAGGVWLDWRGAAESGVVVDVREIREKSDDYKSETTSERDALNEVLKYTTKGVDMLRLPDQHLVEVATVRRWSRMFELLGDCKVSTEKETVNSESAKASDALLDTPCLSGAEFSLESGGGLAEYWSETGSYCYQSPCSAAEFITGEYERAVAEEKRLESMPLPVYESSTYEEFSVSRKMAQLRKLEAVVAASVASDRAPSLRSLGETMPFVEWCGEVERRLAKKRFIRRLLLAQQFEHATFWTLDGYQWGLPPRVVEEI